MRDIRPAVQCLLFDDNRVLLGQRRGDPTEKGGGKYGAPAGHIEEGETIADCARRELLEETGVQATDLSVFCLVEETSASNDHHYLHIGVVVHNWSGEVENIEPDKCVGWEWCARSDLPDPMFPPAQAVLDCYTTETTFKLER